MTPAARRSGAGAAARRRSPPRGAGSTGTQTVFKTLEMMTEKKKKTQKFNSIIFIQHTFVSCAADCGATWAVGEAFCEGEKVYEVEGGRAESAQQTR